MDALYLFTRTNGALLEWLHSPIPYLERGSFAAQLRRLNTIFRAAISDDSARPALLEPATR